MKALCEALSENVVIEELSLAGNLLDNSSMIELNKFLGYDANVISILWLGDRRQWFDCRR